MKFALLDQNKIEATKGAKGLCPVCGSELIAKCGTVKINHWSHKAIRKCDPWWENETEWHRAWKNNFPIEWQECILWDEITGEKHIADLLTSDNLVIEFQHSHIDPIERAKREKFYQNMVWVVDGTRLKRDYSRFLKGFNNCRRTNDPGNYLVDSPEECFPSSWIGSLVPVVFDFRGLESIEKSNDRRNFLYCLIPYQNNTKRLLRIITRESFIKNAISGALTEKPREPQKQPEKPPIQSNIIKKRESTHYFDPQKGRFVRKWRF